AEGARGRTLQPPPRPVRRRQLRGRAGDRRRGGGRGGGGGAGLRPPRAPGGRAHPALPGSGPAFPLPPPSPCGGAPPAARGARARVLLGDPSQLAQPSRAAHPPGAEASALEHLLGPRATIPAGLGLFLPVTRRMHPDVSRFVSEAFYEGRLESAPSCSVQSLA